MLGIRLLVSKATLSAKMTEIRGWLDGRLYTCRRFAAQDQGDHVELEMEFFDAAHAKAFVQRFGGGEIADPWREALPLLTKEELAALLSESKGE